MWAGLEAKLALPLQGSWVSASSRWEVEDQPLPGRLASRRGSECGRLLLPSQGGGGAGSCLLPVLLKQGWVGALLLWPVVGVAWVSLKRFWLCWVGTAFLELFFFKKYTYKYILFHILFHYVFLKINLFIYLFIYLWLRWVFVAAHGLCPVAASGVYSSLPCAGFSLWWLLLLQSVGSRHMGSRAQAQ